MKTTTTTYAYMAALLLTVFTNCTKPFSMQITPTPTASALAVAGGNDKQATMLQEFSAVLPSGSPLKIRIDEIQQIVATDPMDAAALKEKINAPLLFHNDEVETSVLALVIRYTLMQDKGAIRWPCIQFLINNGADCNAKIKPSKNDEYACLHLLCTLQNEDDPSKITPEEVLKVAEWMIEKYENLDVNATTSSTTKTPLMYCK